MKNLIMFDCFLLILLIKYTNLTHFHFDNKITITVALGLNIVKSGLSKHKFNYIIRKSKYLFYIQHNGIMIFNEDYFNTI